MRYKTFMVVVLIGPPMQTQVICFMGSLVFGQGIISVNLIKCDYYFLLAKKDWV